MKQNDRYRYAIAGAALALMVVVVIIVEFLLLRHATGETRESMQLELFKYILQLCVIVIVGGGVALLYKWIERNWDASRERSERRKHYVSRLGDAYRAMKEARRILRASGITRAPDDADAVLSARQIAHYDEQMSVISRKQLVLEALKIESENFPPVAESQALTSEIRKMERYLGQIIDEYETVRPRDKLTLAEMTRITEFTGDGTSPRDNRYGTFQQNFVKPHYRAIKQVAGTLTEHPSNKDRGRHSALPFRKRRADR